jgi:hypothetical protein
LLNGFKVTTAAGYTGRVIILNSSITGLGSFSQAGMSVTTGGSVSIQNSVFEATGAMCNSAQRAVAPSRSRTDEFRANNWLTYVSGNPSVPVVLQLDGAGAGAKALQGNRFGGGIVLADGGSGWQIGGLAAERAMC